MTGQAAHDENPDLRDAFRQAMRRLAGSVAILTTEEAGLPRGIVVTAVMSLTMAPAALVVAVNRTSSISGPLSSGRAFCVNLLGRHHAAMCADFAGLPVDSRFGVGDWARTGHGLPYLRDAQTVVICEQGPVHEFGTHRLIIGLAKEILLGPDVDPLVYADGGYARLSSIDGL